MDKARRRATALALSVTLAIGAIGLGASPASAFRDRDCSDFDTQRQAQKFFKKHGGSKKKDPHRLDADHDGIACEALS